MLSLTFLSLASVVFAQEKGIKFEDGLSWAEIKAKAKQENKYIFMDVFATWCGACKVMDREIYPSETLGAFMNEKYISIKVQADETQSDSENVKKRYQDAAGIVSRYQVMGFPTFLFFTPEGYLINRGVGFQTAKDFRKMAEETLVLSEHYGDKLKEYQQGKMTIPQLKELALEVSAAGNRELAQKIANDCINNHLLKLKSAELFTIDNLSFIGAFLGDRDSKAFKLFNEESKQVNAVLGPFMAERKIMGFIEKMYFPEQVSWKSNKPDWDVLEKKVTNLFGPLGQEIAYGNRMLYHWILGDNWLEFSKYYVNYFEMAFQRPIYHLNNMSWAVFEHVEDPKVLAFAIELMKYDIENFDQNDFVAWDTYANLLHKTGKTEQAIEWEAKAVKMVKGQPGANLYVEALEKMKKNLPTWKASLNK